MIPAYNQKRRAAFPFETGIHFRRKTDFFPEEGTTKSYSGSESEPTRLQAEGHSHHTGWATSSRRRIFLSRNRSSCVAEQFHSDASLEAVDRPAPNNSKNWQWTTEGVLMSASSIRCRVLRCGLCARVPLYMIPLTVNHRRLRLQWAHERRAWQADWHQVVFLDESRFNLWDYDGRIRVRRYAGESCLPKCIIERRSDQTPEVMVWGAILIMDDPICYELMVISVATAQHRQLLPWPAYSSHMSPIEHVWDLVGQCLARDPRPEASKDELLLRIQAIWNSLPQADIQNLFDSMPLRIAALIATRGGYTK
ncbi:transposable element Tcb2 transposase [Trichonephila clavipes]|nr:transposable element Tcb2 transposase [Trichonephila clavipes]